jgi:hypothetical protein
MYYTAKNRVEQTTVSFACDRYMWSVITVRGMKADSNGFML